MNSDSWHQANLICQLLQNPFPIERGALTHVSFSLFFRWMGVSRSEPFISWCFIKVKVDNKNILYAVVCLCVHVHTCVYCVARDAHHGKCVKSEDNFVVSVLSFHLWDLEITSSSGLHSSWAILMAAYDRALSIWVQFLLGRPWAFITQGFSFQDLFLFYMYQCFAYVYVCGPLVLAEVKRMSDPGSGVRDIVKPLYGCSSLLRYLQSWIFFSFLFSFFFWDKILLCISDWPGIHSVN